MIKQEEVYKIGRIGKPHGINGEVHFLFDDDVCDIDTQEKARELTNCDVYFPYSLTDEDPENMRWTQIIGFNLMDANNQQLIGSITGVDDNTMNILFEVERPDGKRILVPANEELIQEVNTDNRFISVQLPEGLLDL